MFGNSNSPYKLVFYVLIPYFVLLIIYQLYSTSTTTKETFEDSTSKPSVGGSIQPSPKPTKLVTPPTELSVTAIDGIKVYINGVKYSKAFWPTSSQVGNNYVVTFDAGLLGFGLNPLTDEVTIVGKIIV